MATLIFDMSPFLPYLTQSDKESLYRQLEAKRDSLGEDQKAQKTRLQLNIFKLRRICGDLNCNENIEKVANLCKVFENHYTESLTLDGKPEKGERKLADDFVLILNETLEDAVHLFPKTNPNALSTYRIGLLEYALQ